VQVERIKPMVQVDPMDPVFKAPGTKRLKLKYNELLSKFAFKFNLRRYLETGVVPLEPRKKHRSQAVQADSIKTRVGT
jgi:hypothetical protein